ncbi:ATP-binding protein [Ostreiculturibacter nitratireducens]|uniref:ATP-binding protein n=1 Tax=Ostreiculturibacter nitratireducens TaxID=3075226 RepID=UPI0031B600E9
MVGDERQAVLEGMPLPVVLIGSFGRIEAANTRARAAFSAGIVGRPYLTVFRQPGLIGALEAALAEGRTGDVRVTISANSHDLVYRVTASPVPLAGGRGAILAFEDVGEREQAEAMRRDFVANVSHELRTPLTALLGFIETLKGAAREDSAARDRFLGIMEREAERMSRLIRDLLSLSRVESEERMRPAQRIDLMVPLRSSIAALKPLADAQDVALGVDGGGEPVMLLADPDQMTQVFSNLIENAIKYGGSGKVVTVEVERIAHDAALRGPAVRISVIDKGEGIDPIHIPRLTERFYRVDTHRSRKQGGTGLGLAIVKHIVSRHRGRFRIESEKGKGSRFSVVLPSE